MVRTTAATKAILTSGGVSERRFMAAASHRPENGAGEEGIMGEASPIGRGAFWPTCELYRRVPLDQRWRLLFDRGPSGAPEEAIGWTDAQRNALARHAVAVRRWLHPILERLPSRDELALVVGVEVEVLNKALNDDGHKMAEAIRAKYARGVLPRDRGVA